MTMGSTGSSGTICSPRAIDIGGSAFQVAEGGRPILESRCYFRGRLRRSGAGRPNATSDGREPNRNSSRHRFCGRKRSSCMGATSISMGIKFAPATIVIDRSGKLRATGLKADFLDQVLNQLLAEPMPLQPELEEVSNNRPGETKARSSSQRG